MPRPDPTRPRDGQTDLFEGVAFAKPDCVLRGRHSDATDAAIAAAAEQHIVDDVDRALLTTLRAGAWALDAFEKENKPYGPAKLIPALTEALREAHMTPESRAAETNDNISELLRDLATPTAS